MHAATSGNRRGVLHRLPVVLAIARSAIAAFAVATFTTAGLALGGALLLPCVAQLAAQAREVQNFPLQSAEGRLMGFYSSALAATPQGIPFPNGAAAWQLEAAFELGFIPYLSRRQRSAGFDKPEASNLSPVLPRPRLTLTLPGGFHLSGHGLPPVTVAGARATLYGLSLSRVTVLSGASIVPRVSYMGGRVEGAITCAEELGSGTVTEQQYYANVCYANESKDHFEPRHLAFDLTMAAERRLAGARPYATAGLRQETTRFDIGVIRADGSRDPDHPVLEMEATRFFAAAGVQWDGAGRLRYAAEVFWTPGSLTTLKLLAGWRVR